MNYSINFHSNRLTRSRDPFEYYSIEFSNLNKQNTLLKAAILSKDLFKNIFYCFFNITIAGANTIRLYKLKKIKPVPPSAIQPTKWQMATFATQVLMLLNVPIPKISILDKITYLFHSKEAAEKHKFSFARELLLSYIPFVSLFNRGKNTYYVFRRSYTDLCKCWAYSYTNPSIAVKYAFIHLSSLFFSIKALHSEALLYLNVAKSIPYIQERFMLELFARLTIDPSDIQYKLENFNNDYYNEFFDRFLRDRNCSRFLLDLRLLGKSNKKKINSPILDPSCPVHAKKIITDQRMFNVCSSENMATLQSDYEKLKRLYKDSSTQLRVNTAWETIKNDCSFHERHKKYSLNKYLLSSLGKLYEIAKKIILN